jgi:hypothetical protein
MKWIYYNIVAVCLVALAAYLIYQDKEGWGWVVFAALCVTVTPKTDDDEN